MSVTSVLEVVSSVLDHLFLGKPAALLRDPGGAPSKLTLVAAEDPQMICFQTHSSEPLINNYTDIHTHKHPTWEFSLTYSHIITNKFTTTIKPGANQPIALSASRD